MRNSGKALLGLMLQHEGEKENKYQAPSSTSKESRMVPLTDEGRADWWVEGWPTPLLVSVHSILLLSLSPQKWQLICGHFVALVCNVPQLCMCGRCLRRHLSRYKCKYSSRASQVPAYLKCHSFTYRGTEGHGDLLNALGSGSFLGQALSQLLSLRLKRLANLNP